MNDAPIRLLLIEDNPGDARLISEMIRDARSATFELNWSDRLAKGLDHLREGQFDVALVDLSLPDATGLDTVIRTRQVAPDLPIVVLTGSASDEKAIAALRAGAEDYLVKGWADAELLVRTLRYAIERKRTEAELARYARELRARNEQIHADLLLAREIQTALLPHHYPSFPPGSSPEQSRLRFHHHYQPATYLAGDFFHVFPISDTMAGVFICDVMGHGVRAALVTAMIRPFVNEFAAKATDPGLLLAKINTELINILQQAQTTIFATAFYLVADLERGQFRYANAGHPHPFLLQRAANNVAPLLTDGRPGPALGLFSNTDYATHQRLIHPGDCVLLYTDGLFEATSPAGDEYGQERLVQSIRANLAQPAPELIQSLLAGIRQFSAVHELPDDVCLLAVETA